MNADLIEYVKPFGEQGYAVLPVTDELDVLLDATKSSAINAMPMLPMSPIDVLDSGNMLSEGHLHCGESQSLYVYRVGSKAVELGPKSVPGTSQSMAARSFVAAARSILEQMLADGKQILTLVGDSNDCTGAGAFMASQIEAGLNAASGGGLDGKASICSLTVQVDDISSEAAFDRDNKDSIDCSYLTLVAVEPEDNALQLYSPSKGSFFSPRVPGKADSKWSIIAFPGHLFEVVRGSPAAMRYRTNMSAWKGRMSSAAPVVGQKRPRSVLNSQKRVSFIARLIPHQLAELNVKRGLLLQLGHADIASCLPSHIARDEIECFCSPKPPPKPAPKPALPVAVPQPHWLQSMFQAHFPADFLAHFPAHPPFTVPFFVVNPSTGEVASTWGHPNESFFAVISRHWMLAGPLGDWSVALLGREYPLSVLVGAAGVVRGDYVTLVHRPITLKDRPAASSQAGPVPSPAPAPKPAPASIPRPATAPVSAPVPQPKQPPKPKAAPPPVPAAKPVPPKAAPAPTPSLEPAPPTSGTSAADWKFVFRVKFQGKNWGASTRPSETFLQTFSPFWKLSGSEVVDFNGRQFSLHTTALEAGLIPGASVELLEKPTVAAPAPNPVPPAAAPVITIALRPADGGSSVHFEVDPGVSFSELAKAYADRPGSGVKANDLRFSYHSCKLRPHDTLQDHSIGDGAVIGVERKSDPNSSAHSMLTVKVRYEGKTDVAYRIRGRITFGVILRTYADFTGLKEADLRLSFQGHRVEPDDTPFSLGMVNNDVVDVQPAQLGD